LEENIKNGAITHLPAKYNVLVNFRIEILSNMNKTIDDDIEKIHEYIGEMIRPLVINEMKMIRTRFLRAGKVK